MSTELLDETSQSDSAVSVKLLSLQQQSLLIMYVKWKEQFDNLKELLLSAIFLLFCHFIEQIYSYTQKQLAWSLSLQRWAHFCKLFLMYSTVNQSMTNYF